MQTPFQIRAARVLAKTPVFEELDAVESRWVSRSSVRKGETLFEKHDPSEHLFGLVSGQLKLFAHNQERREISLAVMGPGDLIGEEGIADGAPRSVSAMALANCELATIHTRDLKPLMSRHPNLRDALARACAVSVRRLMERAEDAAFMSLEERIEKALRDLAVRVGEATLEGTRIGLRQRDLADLLGTSRESVSKVLTSPAMQGRVVIGRGSIVLLGV